MEKGKEFLEQFENAHDGNWNSFFRIYNPKNSYKKSLSLKIAIITSIVLQIFLLYSNTDLFIIFKNLVSRNLSIIPNILGFSIGAYALLISGFSEKILKKIAKTKLKNNKLPYNSFQKTSSIFGMAIFSMSICLLLNYFIQIIIDSNFFYQIIVSNTAAKIVNSIILVILNIISIYALLLIFNTIINLFAFSQFISAILTLEKKEDEVEKKDEEV